LTLLRSRRTDLGQIDATCTFFSRNLFDRWDPALRSPIKGRFLLPYGLIAWSRKIVAARVHDHESNAPASEMIEQARHRERIDPRGVVIHRDKRAGMKSMTPLAKCSTWASCRRSAVSPRRSPS